MAKQTRLTKARRATKNAAARARRLRKKLELASAEKKAATTARAAARREKLVLDHLHIVDRITDQVARKMTHLDPEDLRQAGFVGLMQAADRYKRKNGVFAHYCYFRIRGEMFDAHKRSAYRDDTMFLHSIDELRRDGDEIGWPSIVVPDHGPLPDAIAAKREQAMLLAEALDELEPDERRVFTASLNGVPLIRTARECGHTVAWARVKLAAARLQLAARVQMWGLGLEERAA